jgi:hypothetical protein
MPRTYKLVRPNSPVEQCLTVFPFKRLAEVLGLSPMTIRMWAKLDRVPVEHVVQVANLTGRDPLHILAYMAENALPWPSKKGNTKPLEALAQDNPGKGEKIALTRWGECAHDLVKHLESFNRAFTSFEELAKAKHEAAESLGVSYRQVNRLLVRYQVTPVLETPKHRLDRAAANKNRSTRLNASLACIRRNIPLDQAAAQAEVSARTIYRYLTDLLNPYEIKLKDLISLPESLRYAIAFDVEQEESPDLTKRLLTFWLRKKLVQVFSEVKREQTETELHNKTHTFKRASVPQALRGLASGEITLRDLQVIKETTQPELELWINSYLRMMGFNYREFTSKSRYHHQALSDVVSAFEAQALRVKSKELA